MQLKPEEISKVIRSQIKYYDNAIKQNETGTVLMVGDGIARASGLINCMAGELLEFEDGSFGMAQNLEENSVSIVLFGDDSGIGEGQTVKRTGKVVSVPVGEAMIGRVVNALGQPIDGAGPVVTSEYRAIESPAPGICERQGVNQPLQTGIKAIDSMVPIGKKAVEYSKRNGFACVTESFGEIADVSVADCFEMANLLCGEFKKGEFGHIDLCYTKFVSMLSQQPSAIPVLPLKDLTDEQDTKSIRNLILYEPDASEVFDAIVPEYLAGLIYGAVCESVASELAARRTAMEAATNNAEEMIEKLNLHYNRARQASITQEITEIVGGAEGV